MTLDPRLPVIVGVGQVTWRAAGLDEALSPVELMTAAVRAALDDAGIGAVGEVDSIRVVELLSWRYRDPARFVADALGLRTRETALTTGGGNTPQSLVNRTARDIASGTQDLVVLTGAEAWRTRMRARKQGATLPWPTVPEGIEPDVLLGTPLEMNLPEELARGIDRPVQVYPMFETALRAAAGRTPDDHLVHISELWARFAAVAADNPNAWIRDARSAERLRTVSASNRMIGLPYPKSLNSNNDVDQGAALVMCSVERARSLGVPSDRWVFPHAGSDCREHTFISHRQGFADTPAIRVGGTAALGLAGLGIDDVALIDLYSCFPSAVQLGAQSLGLDLGGRLTRTGGLTFAGGPWNNYVMHAIATMVSDLRREPDEYGLVWGNGGYVTKHSFGIYSARPPAAGFRHATPQAEIDALPGRRLAPPTDAAGPATVEAYTVMHERDGAPHRVIAACLLADGRRAWGTSDDVDEARRWCDGEWVHRTVELAPDGTVAG